MVVSTDYVWLRTTGMASAWHGNMDVPRHRRFEPTLKPRLGRTRLSDGEAFPSECQDDTELLRGRGRQSAPRREFEGVARRYSFFRRVCSRSPGKSFCWSSVVRLSRKSLSKTGQVLSMASLLVKSKEKRVK